MSLGLLYRYEGVAPAGVGGCACAIACVLRVIMSCTCDYVRDLVRINIIIIYKYYC